MGEKTKGSYPTPGGQEEVKTGNGLGWGGRDEDGMGCCWGKIERDRFEKGFRYLISDKKYTVNRKRVAKSRK